MKNKKRYFSNSHSFLRAFVNPVSELQLSISTSIQAKDMIVQDLVKASEIVKDQMKKFVNEHIGTSPTMSFLDPAKKDQAKHIQEHE